MNAVNSSAASRGVFLAVGLILLLGAGQAVLAQDNPRTNCNCEDSVTDVCTQDGYRLRLLNFQIDQVNSMSLWDYQVCNEAGLGTGCEPPAELKHIDIGLPAIGDCLTSSQAISILQHDGFDAATMTCTVGNTDPACGLVVIENSDFIANCEFTGGTKLDPGDCVTLRLSFEGETPTLGSGAALSITEVTVSPDCHRDCVLGPSCFPCGDPPPPPPTGDGCLTRTKGFWGNHPHITGLYNDSITVCGHPLNTVEAGTCTSITEALCVSPGKEARRHVALAQMERQLAAAKLNLAASAALGGSCEPSISTRIAQCEALCGATEKRIKNSQCVQDLAAFNESQDTVAMTSAPFDSPGPANPRECQEANGNGRVIGLGGCS